MKCIILAAGYATRLYPLTENFPKPLLKVGEKNILDWLVDDIDTEGVIDEYIVVSNHRYAEHFRLWAETKAQKITVVDDGTTSNDTRLGAVRDIQFAVEALNIKDDILVLAGDNVLDFSLTSFIRYAMEKDTSCIMRYYEPVYEKLIKCGVVEVDGNDLVLSMTEKSLTPATNWCCPPFYFYKQADVEMLEQGMAEGCGTDAPGSYAAWLSTKTKVHAMEMPGSRYDIGNLESYEKVKKEYRGIK